MNMTDDDGDNDSIDNSGALKSGCWLHCTKIDVLRHIIVMYRHREIVSMLPSAILTHRFSAAAVAVVELQNERKIAAC